MHDLPQYRLEASDSGMARRSVHGALGKKPSRKNDLPKGQALEISAEAQGRVNICCAAAPQLKLLNLKSLSLLHSPSFEI